MTRCRTILVLSFFLLLLQGLDPTLLVPVVVEGFTSQSCIAHGKTHTNKKMALRRHRFVPTAPPLATSTAASSRRRFHSREYNNNNGPLQLLPLLVAEAETVVSASPSLFDSIWRLVVQDDEAILTFALTVAFVLGSYWALVVSNRRRNEEVFDVVVPAQPEKNFLTEEKVQRMWSERKKLQTVERTAAFPTGPAVEWKEEVVEQLVTVRTPPSPAPPGQIFTGSSSSNIPATTPLAAIQNYKPPQKIWVGGTDGMLDATSDWSYVARGMGSGTPTVPSSAPPPKNEAEEDGPAERKIRPDDVSRSMNTYTSADSEWNYLASARVFMTSTPVSVEPMTPFTPSPSVTAAEPTVYTGNYMNSLGRGSSSSKKNSYAMSQWSPKGKVAPAAMTGSASSYLSAVPSVPAVAPVSPSPTATIFVTPEPPSATTAPATMTSSLVAPTSPRGVGSTSSGYMAGLGGSSSLKDSYATSKWKPGSKVTEIATGNPYLASMSSSSALSTGLPVQPTPPPAPPPAMMNDSMYVSDLSLSITNKKSYAMTFWSPFDKVNEFAVGPTYLGMMEAAYSQGAAPVQPVVLAPMSTPDAATFNMEITRDATIDVSSESIMNTASLPIPSGVSSVTGVTVDEKATIADRAATPAPPSIGFTSIPSPSTIQAPSREEYLRGLAKGSPVVQSKKKSYSMSKWHPKNKVNNAAPSGSSTTYLANMNLIAKTLAPVSPSYNIPALSPLAMTTATSAVGYCASSVSSGGGSLAAPTPSPLVTSRDYIALSNKGSVFDGNTSPKPSSLMSASATSEQSGSSGGFYSGISSSESGSTATSVSPSPTTMKLPEPPVFESGFAGSADILGAGSTSSSTAKSYSMSKWSPGSQLNSGSGSLGIGASYLDQMNSAAVGVKFSVTPSPSVAAPNPAPPASKGGFLAEIDSSGVVASTSGSQKSYSMSKWSPDAPMKGFEAIGISDSYLDGMTAISSSVAPSTAVPTPGGSVLSNSLGVGSKSTSKKSYSMSKWSPASLTNVPSGTVGIGASYLAGMGPKQSEVTPVSAPVPAPPVSGTSYMSDTNSGISVSPETSYSMSKWSPSRLPKRSSGTVGAGSPYLDQMSSSATGASLFSALADPSSARPRSNVSNGGASTSTKSHATSKWSPGSLSTGSLGEAGVGASSLEKMSISPENVKDIKEAPDSSPAPAPTFMNGFMSATDSVADETAVSKKSYSMTKFSPGSQVRGANGARSVGTSNTGGMGMGSGWSSISRAFSGPAPSPASPVLKDSSMTSTRGVNGIASISTQSFSKSTWASDSPTTDAFDASENGASFSDEKNSNTPATSASPSAPARSPTPVLRRNIYVSSFVIDHAAARRMGMAT
jgi:hypothetical protein